jgi:hypothetical protein
MLAYVHSYWEGYLWSHKAQEFPFNFILEYAAREVQEIVVGL